MGLPELFKGLRGANCGTQETTNKPIMIGSAFLRTVTQLKAPIRYLGSLVAAKFWSAVSWVKARFVKQPTLHLAQQTTNKKPENVAQPDKDYDLIESAYMDDVKAAKAYDRQVADYHEQKAIDDVARLSKKPESGLISAKDRRDEGQLVTGRVEFDEFAEQDSQDTCDPYGSTRVKTPFNHDSKEVDSSSKLVFSIAAISYVLQQYIAERK